MRSILAALDTKVGFLRNKGLVEPSEEDPQIYCNRVTSKMFDGKKIITASSAGSGVSLQDARAASFYEGIERYAFMAPTACYENLIKLDQNTKCEVLSPYAFNFYNRDQSEYVEIKKHIECKKKSRLWIECNNLTASHSTNSLIPLGTVLREKNGTFFEHTTSGMGAGRSFDQANYSALCEAIERDAFMYSWWAKEKLITFEFQKYVETDYKLRFLWNKLSSVRNNIKIRLIPTILGDYSVVASFQSGAISKFPFFSMGMAYRPNLRDAIYKALIELSQLLQSSDKQKMESWDSVKDYDNLAKSCQDTSRIYYWPESEELLGHYHHLAEGTFLESPNQERRATLEFLTGMCLKKNVRIYSVDLTLPDIEQLGAKVCKIVSPDLIPLNLNNHLKPYGHKRFKPVEQLNKNPHPFS